MLNDDFFRLFCRDMSQNLRLFNDNEIDKIDGETTAPYFLSIIETARVDTANILKNDG